METKRGLWITREMELKMVVSYHGDAEHGNAGLCENS